MIRGLLEMIRAMWKVLVGIATFGGILTVYGYRDRIWFTMLDVADWIRRL